MATEESGIVIEITGTSEDLGVDLERLKTLARHVVSKFQIAAANVSIAIEGDEAIKDVNRRFLDCSSATDVISFDLSDNPDECRHFDMVVNADMAERQGKKRGHSTEAELALYITHGLLHNLGFDDQQPDQAQKMHAAEDEILQQAGFGVIYDTDKQGSGPGYIAEPDQ